MEMPLGLLSETLLEWPWGLQKAKRSVLPTDWLLGIPKEQQMGTHLELLLAMQMDLLLAEQWAQLSVTWLVQQSGMLWVQQLVLRWVTLWERANNFHRMRRDNWLL